MAATLPEGAFLKDISAWYNAETVPRWLRAGDRLPAGTWALVVVEDGTAKFQLESKRGAVSAGAKSPALIAPETRFQFESSSKDARFCLHYYHAPILGDAGNLAAELRSNRSG